MERTESGLRDRKRQQTRERILAQAITVFRSQGIRPAHLGEIARLSQVSQATLFNYFANKGALAEAWVRGEVDSALQESSIDLSERGLRPAMRAFCGRVADLVSVAEDHEARLEAWRESGRASSRSLEAMRPLGQALGLWQKRERVRGDIDANTMAEMLVDAIESGLIAGLRQRRSGSELAGLLRSRVDLILDGARKRNERVAAPRASGPEASWTRRPVQSR